MVSLRVEQSCSVQKHNRPQPFGAFCNCLGYLAILFDFILWAFTEILNTVLFLRLTGSCGQHLQNILKCSLEIKIEQMLYSDTETKILWYQPKLFLL